MNEEAQLLVNIHEQEGRWLKVSTLIEDNTEVFFEVDTHHVTEIEGSIPLTGWLAVEFSGENNKRANIVLPRPVLHMGKRITVSTSRVNRPVSVSTLTQPQPPQIIPITTGRKGKKSKTKKTNTAKVDPKRSAAAKKAWAKRKKAGQ